MAERSRWMEPRCDRHWRWFVPGVLSDVVYGETHAGGFAHAPCAVCGKLPENPWDLHRFEDWRPTLVLLVLALVWGPWWLVRPLLFPSVRAWARLARETSAAVTERREARKLRATEAGALALVESDPGESTGGR